MSAQELAGNHFQPDLGGEPIEEDFQLELVVEPPPESTLRALGLKTLADAIEGVRQNRSEQAD
ncbi:MAG: hypothetical protein AAB896_01600 [Patescibacteria group bacterium]